MRDVSIPLRSFLLALLVALVPAVASAQRELHWDALDVDAHLAADGRLEVSEAQTMVFTGDWNGGERIFNIRPHQKIDFSGIYRDSGNGWQKLTEDSDLDTVDDYAWADSKTLRWRSRLRSDPLFTNTVLRYQLRYTLSGILLQDGNGYLLNHDFAFPDRAGVIRTFRLMLTLDPVWQSAEPVRDVYTTTNMPPGDGFVLRIPLRYRGAGTPSILDQSRPAPIQLAVLVLIVFTGIALTWFFVGEAAKGRFAPIEQADHITEPWLRENILNHPAEIVGAAWDDTIGQAEVVALLARLTSEGTLESEASGEGRHSSMTLHLKANRDTLDGYERKLVDKLFFGGHTTTSTDQVKSHYKETGFDPVSVIRKDLESAVKASFPFDATARKFRVETLVLFMAGLLALCVAFYQGYGNTGALVGLGIGSVIFPIAASICGGSFRSRMDWGRRNALWCLVPGLLIAAGTAAFLWFYAGTGTVELDTLTLSSIVLLALAAINMAVNSLKSRQGKAGIAARKTLTAARAFFAAQLQQRQPALRDEWYPWVLAFDLNEQMDDWSTRAAAMGGHDSQSFSRVPTPSSGSSSGAWTGFGGGRSGGGGAGASWAAAAGGLAAGVSAPSSNSSGGGSSGGSSGGGSSGGGGGGGW